MPQESLKMISNSISMGLGRSPLGLNQQVAGGSRSSVLLSRIDFEPCDGGGKLSTEALRAKYAPLSPSPVHNGLLNKNNSLHKLGKPTTNGATTNGDAVNGGREEEDGEDGIPEPRVRLHSSDAVWLDWRERRRIGAGLINLGNTCFMNTVIQCLTYCPPLANYLLHQDDHCTKCKTINFCMMCELQRHMKRALEKPGDAIKPLYIYQRLKAIAKHFQFGQQEDAHEFLRYVVDNLWKAALSNYEGGVKLDPASKETTVVNEIFGGYHRSQVTCMKCKEKSNTYDHFMDLILDIKNASSLEKALEKFVEPELLQNENAYKCPRCNIKVMAQKRFTVHRAPNVATFQFKRFDSNRMFGGKITKHVSYPEHLELRPYMSDKHGDPVTYRLNAVLVHLGASCNSGHYFCFVRNSNGSWYCMDDSRVNQVSLGQVLNQQAYVLFYVRTPAESQENHTVKKSNSTATLSNRNSTSEPLRNGQLLSVESSTTSVNSTTDWNVTDKERASEARKPVAEEFPGWTVVEPAATVASTEPVTTDGATPGSSKDAAAVSSKSVKSSAGGEESALKAPKPVIGDDDAATTSTDEKEQQLLRPFLGDGRSGVIDVDTTETGPPGDGTRRSDALPATGEPACTAGSDAISIEPPVRPVVPPPNSAQTPAPTSNGCVMADTDDSSDSHEWVERTKETLAAERRHSANSKATVHQWDARPSVNGSKDGPTSHWNGNNNNNNNKKQTDIMSYFHSNGSRQYGYAVNGWGRETSASGGGGGGGYHNGYGSGRGGSGDGFYRDKRKYYDDYDNYDDEYDKGKQKRKSNGFGPHPGSHYRNGPNPFQEAQNFRNQQRGGGGGGHRFHQQFQRFQKGPPPFYARHHNRQHSGYGPPRRKHHYSRTR
ncbi:ubiquitin specific peptidase 36 isoform X2 [Amblyomma americanum]